VRVNDRLKINVFVAVITAVVILFLLSLAVYRVGRAIDELQIANQIIAKVLEKIIVRDDYLNNNTERARRQWIIKHEQLGRLLESAKQRLKDAEDKRMIDEMIKAQESIGKLFSAIVENREKTRLGKETAFSRQLEDRIVTQLNMRVYTTILNGRQLQDSVRESLSLTMRMAGLGIVCMLLIVISAVIFDALIMSRTIVSRIKMLKEGAKIIGDGNLDYVITIKGDDEFVELSAEINEMTTRLRESYYDLEKEIVERKRTAIALKESESKLKILNENLENTVAQRTQQVRGLSKELTIAEQRERQRFSSVLHEDLQQILFGAKMLIDTIDFASLKDAEANHQEILEVKKLLQNAISTTKSLAVELNPPILKNEGLDAALKWLARNMEERYGLVICIDISKDLSVVQGIDQILIVQLARELLLNIVKHARTHEVVISGVREGDTVSISIEDKGVGFDVEEMQKNVHDTGKMGLFSITERLRLFGGKLSIQSQTGKGTRIRIEIPLTILESTSS
jgi:signal transduction histidine kinase